MLVHLHKIRVNKLFPTTITQFYDYMPEFNRKCNCESVHCAFVSNLGVCPNFVLCVNNKKSDSSELIRIKDLYVELI